MRDRGGVGDTCTGLPWEVRSRYRAPPGKRVVDAGTWGGASDAETFIASIS